MPELVTVNTEFGPLIVDGPLLRLWNALGWPEDDVLKVLVDKQREARDADA